MKDITIDDYKQIYALIQKGAITEHQFKLALKMIVRDNEDYEMLADENKNMAKALSKLGYTRDQISDICNGAI
jgi:Holliday junction resolvasome RuvABC DNA-binding subunit